VPVNPPVAEIFINPLCNFFMFIKINNVTVIKNHNLKFRLKFGMLFRFNLVALDFVIIKNKIQRDFKLEILNGLQPDPNSVSSYKYRCIFVETTHALSLQRIRSHVTN